MNTQQTRKTQLYNIRDRISYYQSIREDAEKMITSLHKEEYELQKLLLFMKED